MDTRVGGWMDWWKEGKEEGGQVEGHAPGSLAGTECWGR